jgi:tetratricopeptide (TPR) repeat protein
MLLHELIPLGVIASAPVQASKGTVVLPTYDWLPSVPHPFFQETDAKNIYPYPMFDNLSRSQTNRSYRTVVLENEFLRITFLPELGGKIYEVLDKTTGQPMFYVNHVVKPGLIGMCGAWTSGGVEWNTGPQGHTVGAMQPMDVIILPTEPDGSRSVAIGETECIYGTQWIVQVRLRPGRSFIEEHIRIYNPTTFVRPYYFWNCTAAPNTRGFRFIYPMTLGCDHGGEKFFRWPIDQGKDLSRGTNYQDASSIFAWYCDQDFFGSYDDVADRGVVAYANHRELPGKKAWTWGQGGFGRMHQMDLTDTDGPYNEVQTGPLLTQAEVGRLDPCEAVEWTEWWYPVHSIGGFTYANRDLAVNAVVDQASLKLRALGTGRWDSVDVRVLDSSGTVVTHTRCRISARQKTELTLALPPDLQQPELEWTDDNRVLARFRVPLALPARQQPAPKPKPATAAELASSGWREYLFARYDEAEKRFKDALQKDPKSVSALTGLAFVFLQRDPAMARTQASAALAVEPDNGLANIALAVLAADEDPSSALDHAWQAALDPGTAVAARALAAKIQLSQRQYEQAITTLSEPGPWLIDSLCRDRRALAYFKLGQAEKAIQLAQANLVDNPLDSFALAVLWLAKSRPETERLRELIEANGPSLIQLAGQFTELKQPQIAYRLFEEFYVAGVPRESWDALTRYWIESLASQLGMASPARAKARGSYPPRPVRALFPHGSETLAVLRDAVSRNPADGHASLFLGNILFNLGQDAPARQAWQHAAELGPSRAVAYRALGMAKLKVDNDPISAVDLLSRAHDADPKDAIVARDLARVLFAQAEKTESGVAKTNLWQRGRNVLTDALEQGKSRSDFVCLLGSAQNRLGDYTATVRLLGSVRITVWEGSHEAHDLFEQAHLALGRDYLKSGQTAEALAEFNRALEYPENLATGRLENKDDSEIHRLRAEALTTLGQPDAARQAREQAEKKAK